MFPTARQVVEPIFSAAFNIDSERNLPVLKLKLVKTGVVLFVRLFSKNDRQNVLFTNV